MSFDPHSNIFKVARISGKRRTRSGLQYLCEWEGWGPEDDSWEPEAIWPRSSSDSHTIYVCMYATLGVDSSFPARVFFEGAPDSMISRRRTGTQ